MHEAMQHRNTAKESRRVQLAGHQQPRTIKPPRDLSATPIFSFGDTTFGDEHNSSPGQALSSTALNGGGAGRTSDLTAGWAVDADIAMKTAREGESGPFHRLRVSQSSRGARGGISISQERDRFLDILLTSLDNPIPKLLPRPLARTN